MLPLTLPQGLVDLLLQLLLDFLGLAVGSLPVMLIEALAYAVRLALILLLLEDAIDGRHVHALEPLVAHAHALPVDLGEGNGLLGWVHVGQQQVDAVVTRYVS